MILNIRLIIWGQKLEVTKNISDFLKYILCCFSLHNPIQKNISVVHVTFLIWKVEPQFSKKIFSEGAPKHTKAAMLTNILLLIEKVFYINVNYFPLG